LLHLPPPHSPGIYDPKTDEFTTTPVSLVAGYFNNLVLADRWLGKLRNALDSATSKTNTWIILSSDHAWRKSRDYDGGSDPRVPFLVKAPGETNHLTYSHAFNTVITHDWIIEILQGGITGQQTLVSWLDTHAKLN